MKDHEDAVIDGEDRLVCIYAEGRERHMFVAFEFLDAALCRFSSAEARLMPHGCTGHFFLREILQVFLHLQERLTEYT
ncbi:MAG: hypothetical protein WCB46_09295 [Methanoregula sp.]